MTRRHRGIHPYRLITLGAVLAVALVVSTSLAASPPPESSWEGPLDAHGYPLLGQTVALESGPGVVFTHPQADDMVMYIGDVHQHTSFSGDGRGGPPDVAYAAARARGLDFLALSEHHIDLIYHPERWQAMQYYADQANEDGRFVAIRGYEFTASWGHINVWGTDSIEGWPSTGIGPDAFYDWLRRHPEAIASFNHPSPPNAYIGYQDWTFRDWYYRRDVDGILRLVEGTTYYWNQALRGLSLGWHVGIIGYGDGHDAQTAGRPVTGILAPSLTRANVLDALRHRRTFGYVGSSWTPLGVAMKANDAWMGSLVAPRFPMTVTVWAANMAPDAPITTIRLVAGGGGDLCNGGNGVTLATVSPNAQSATWTYVLPQPLCYRYIIAVAARDTGTAYSSPIWITPNVVDPVAGPVQTVVLQPSTSYRGLTTAVIDGWAPTTSYPNQLKVRPGVRSTLMRWDLSSIPPTARVTQAILSMRLSYASNAAELTVTAHRLLRPWGATEATWNGPRRGETWGFPGALQAGVDRDPQMIDARIARQNKEPEFSLEITGPVQDWVSNPSSNLGLMLRGWSLSSVEYGFTSPQLTVSYVLPDGSASPTPTPTVVPTATPTSVATATPTPSPTPSPTATAVGPGGTVVLTPIADAMLYAAIPTKNYGAQSTAYCGAYSSTMNGQPCLFAFDLSSIPPGATITSAQLHLYGSAQNGPGTLTLGVYAVRRPWSETRTTWVTPDGVTPWGTAGAENTTLDREATASATALAYGSPAHWTIIDITGLVQRWVDGSLPNHGLKLMKTGGTATNVLFSMREAASHRPQLVVSWVAP